MTKKKSGKGKGKDKETRDSSRFEDAMEEILREMAAQGRA
jgi:hypothetical protein